MSGSHFLGTPARSALIWVTVSQKISSTLSLDRPTLDSGHSGHLAAHHLGLGQAYGFAQDYNGITPVEPVQVEEWWTGDALSCVGVV